MARKIPALFVGLLFALILLVRPVSVSAESLVFPGHLERIEAEAFCGDISVQAAVLQEGILSIGSRAFADTSLSEITLPASLTSIADDAFDGAPLKTVHAKKGTYAYQWMREHGWLSEYRALLIGEQRYVDFWDDDPTGGRGLKDRDQRNIGDLRLLSPAFGNLAGPADVSGSDGNAIQVIQKTNLSYWGVRSAIQSAFADTMDQDISFFFIATHGDSKSDGDLMMAFTGDIADEAQVTAYWNRRYLSFGTLASWLNEYAKGRVVVILESCGSGSSIYDENVEENSPGKRRGSESDSPGAAEYFVLKAIDAFSAADPGISNISTPLASPRGTMLPNSTGDLRQPKFFVLAASRHQEESYGWETKEEATSYNYFTKWLIEGIGTKGNSPADADGDGYLTLQELFSYLRQYNTYPFNVHGTIHYQHVQCYPQNSDYKLLKLK